MTATALVPLDGSDKDERALPIAADFAQVADVGLHLLRVLDPVATTGGMPPAARGDAERAVRGVAERVARTVGRPVTWEVLDGGDVAGVLIGRGDALNAAAVVMATRAPRAIDRMLHGSVADRVVRESGRPVILVPPRADYLRGRKVCLRRGVVPLDGSAAALEVISHLLALPRAHELELVLLEVVPPPPGLAEGPAMGGAHVEGAARRLEAVAARVRARGARAEVRVVEAVDPAAAVIDALRQDLADFIAMSTRGAGGVERMVLGSVATTVVRASEVPVYLVTPAARVRAGA